MKILSLYDGMSCGYIAFKELGIPIERYVSYEIDKYAVKTSLHNFPDIEPMGDVFGGGYNKYEGFDFLIAGSPCQKWSIAQKVGRETEPKGQGWDWFQQVVKALKEAKPKYFIYENNKSMPPAIKSSISKAFGLEPTMINSAIFSAQTRKRLYWVGERQADGTYKKVSVNIPEDKGICLKDILDEGAIRIPEYGCEKSRPINAYYPNNCGGFELRMFSDNPNKQQVDMIAEPVSVECAIFSQPHGWNEGVLSYNKTPTLLTGSQTRQQNVLIIRYHGEPIENPMTFINRVYEVKDGKVTIKGKQYSTKLTDGFYIIRKLTVGECMKLQTIPEWYEFPVSNSRAYHMLGNGWTVSVIEFLIKSILKK